MKRFIDNCRWTLLIVGQMFFMWLLLACCICMVIYEDYATAFVCFGCFLFFTFIGIHTLWSVSVDDSYMFLGEPYDIID